MSKKKNFLTGLLCACVIAASAGMVYAEVTVSSYTTPTTQTTTNTTQTPSQSSSQRAWSHTSVDKVKKQIQEYNDAINKQLNINYENLFKTATLNKVQKGKYDKYTSEYKTALKVTKESMSFYLDDLNDIATSNVDDNTKARMAEDINTKARTSFAEILNSTQTYLSNCAYVMPTLTYQKFLKGFEQNYALGKMDTERYSSMTIR